MQVEEAARPYDLGPANGRIGTIADAMLAARTLAEMDAALRMLRDVFALSYCRYEARFPAKGRHQELLLIAGGPTDELLYAEAWGDAIDKVREHCRVSICPLLWKDDDLRDPGSAEGPERPGGPSDGMLNLAIPLSSRTGDYAALHGYWGPLPPMTEREAKGKLPELAWTALHFHEAMRQMMLRESLVSGDRLTLRETECLRWISQGKTSWEIAQILNVTEHTVIFHANNSMRKLGVNARAAAVQRAMSLGYL